MQWKKKRRNYLRRFFVFLDNFTQILQIIVKKHTKYTKYYDFFV